MRVVYLNCLRAPARRRVEEVLADWRTLRDVPAALSQAGVHVEVVQRAGSAAVLRRNDVTFRFVPGGPWRLAEAAAASQPDVVHQQAFHFAVDTAVLRRRLPEVPLLVQDHGGSPPRGWRRLAAVLASGAIQGAAFTAREQARPYVQNGMLRRETPVFEVLESSTFFTPGDQRAAQRASGVRGDPSFLWVGRLDRNKDPLSVLAAFARARRDLPDPHLWLCYTAAPLLGAVRRRLELEPELGGRVHLLGVVPHDRLEVLFRAADFFVLGSHAEGSGYALLEALACGTTPLVTDIPSFRRMTGQGRVGALSAPGDIEAMARAMVAWSRADRAALRHAARSHFDQALSFSVVAAELKAAYEALAGAR